jgi:hypothetical protein
LHEVRLCQWMTQRNELPEMKKAAKWYPGVDSGEASDIRPCASLSKTVVIGPVDNNEIQTSD